ncbi:polyprenol monophosphomannose synthase [Alienimonas californiensis]|uniref:Undecaprenyl-phosphate mannosyltransferase n=1 Tax=Alienimonas californiensis TaxID=2527989 RepID=A0A517P9T2_9PLAN|nr:polyprenol monophosphomannose synthase [Alienimonas californiensis]QDT16129.1 Undecaprenyl-phosphate mannosyltransferase [Alienimonas californiensis]
MSSAFVPHLYVPPTEGQPERPDVSVVIPTYREAENLPELIARLFAATDAAGLSAEALIVDDDSRDGTEALCAELAKTHPVRLILRRHERGLATAALRGLSEGRGDVLVVMDADLSHPPEALPALVAAVMGADDRGGADFAIGSRYVPGGQIDAGWGRFRQWNSKVATRLARGLTNAADPLAGFFALRRETFAACGPLDPVGYKIGLELLVKSGARRVAEVPITFRDRTRGSSKLTLGQQLAYLRHLGKLYAFNATRAAA